MSPTLYLLCALTVFTALHNLSASAEVRCADISLECEYRQKYCFNSAYTGLMFKVCRSTCDWCQKSLNDVIMSNKRRFFAAPGQIPELSELQQLTQVTETSENPITGSASNQSTENPIGCSDTSATCSKTSALCSSPNYQQIMSVKCPKTCGKC